MSKAGGGKGVLGMKRKTFFLTVVIVCAALLIVEAALLIHTFTKKKKPAKKTPEEVTEAVADTGPVPFLTKEAPEGYRIVWKVAKEYEITSGQKRLKREVLAFDDAGREVRACEYSENGEMQYVDYTYTDFGTKITRRDKYQRLVKTTFTDISGEVFEASADIAEFIESSSGSFALTYTVEISPEESSSAEAVMVSWTLAPYGKTIKRDRYLKNYAVEFEEYDTATMTLDEKGRIIRNEYRRSWDDPSDPSQVTEYQYDGETRTETRYRNGRIASKSIWNDRLQAYTYIEQMIKANDIEKEIWKCYCPDGRYPATDNNSIVTDIGAIDYIQIKEDGTTSQIYTAELNKYGQPVRDEQRFLFLQYDENGHCKSFNYQFNFSDTEPSESEVATYLLKYDEYGNLLEVINEDGSSGSIFEWVALEVAE